MYDLTNLISVFWQIFYYMCVLGLDHKEQCKKLEEIRRWGGKRKWKGKINLYFKMFNVGVRSSMGFMPIGCVLEEKKFVITFVSLSPKGDKKIKPESTMQIDFTLL